MMAQTLDIVNKLRADIRLKLRRSDHKPHMQT